MSTFPLTEQEKQRYSQHDQRCIQGLRALLSVCDGAENLDGQGFNKVDTTFARSLQSQLQMGRRLTERQLTALRSMLVKYQKQLLNWEINLSEPASSAMVKPNLPSYPTCDLRDGKLWVYIPYNKKPVFDEFRKEWENRSKRKEKGFKGFVLWGANSAKEWHMPASEEAVIMLTLPKYFPNMQFTVAAYALKESLEEKVASTLISKKATDDKRKEELKSILVAICKKYGVKNLNQPLPFGITLYPHQRQGIYFALWKRKCIIADRPGLGKTWQSLIAADALRLCYGYKIVVVTTKTMQREWIRYAHRMDIPVTIYSWGKLPVIDADNEQDWEDYVFICDEAQNAQNWKSKRTEKMINFALHPKCKALFHLTGSPLPNGRPVNAYPLLYTCEHELVYHSNEKRQAFLKREYEKTFCGAGPMQVGKYKTVWDTNGATNLKMWHRLFIHKHGDDNNNPSACIIARRQQDTDMQLPPLTRIMQEVEVDTEDLTVFNLAVYELQEKFNNNVQAKLDEFIAAWNTKKHGPITPYDIMEEEERIRTAEAMVLIGIYLHAAARAKVKTTIEQACNILASQEKVVIFTTFTDVAHAIAEGIRKQAQVSVGIIEGQTSELHRNVIIEDFQNDEGVYQVIISTKAGGEGITLTKACYMLIVDRPWTPGRVAQWEGRIYRATQKYAVTVYWMQLPEEVDTIDLYVDTIIQKKEININISLYGESKGLSFVEDLQGIAKSLMLGTLKKFGNEGTR